MTLKQRRFIQAIPTSKSIKEAAKKAGYSEYTADSSIHTLIRNSKGLKKYFDEDYIRKEVRIAVKKVKSKQDYTNLFRGLELMSKIEGMQLDRSEIKGQSQTIIVDNSGRFNKSDEKSILPVVDNVKKD